jgi:hypothetical protein
MLGPQLDWNAGENGLDMTVHLATQLK